MIDKEKIKRYVGFKYIDMSSMWFLFMIAKNNNNTLGNWFDL
jgi:hypothetical protein